MMVCHTLVETSLVRPGLVEVSDKDASVKLNEDRLNMLRIAGVNKAKGLMSYHLTMSHNHFSEIKNLLLQLQILGEVVKDGNYESGCLVRELNAQTCRQGCQICFLNAKLEQIKRICPDIKDGTRK